MVFGGGAAPIAFEDEHDNSEPTGRVRSDVARVVRGMGGIVVMVGMRVIRYCVRIGNL